MAGNKDNNLPISSGTVTDITGALIKGGIGTIPIFGPILAELFGLVVPSQRLDRAEECLRLVVERLNTADPEELRRRLGQPEAVDLLEEGVVQAVRAISGERKAYIAQIVANGINGNEKAKIEAKRLLKLLQEIDDEQVIILLSRLNKYRHDANFYQKHIGVIGATPITTASTLDDIDQNAVSELARSQLMRLGLLDVMYRQPRKGEMAELDPKTGKMKAGAIFITALGRLFLVRIGLAKQGEF